MLSQADPDTSQQSFVDLLIICVQSRQIIQVPALVTFTIPAEGDE